MIIVLEGANGTGTTTIANKLNDHFGDKSILTRHPGSTPLGANLRKILKYGDVKTTPQQELLLFAADALSFFQSVVMENQDKIIICDRINLVGALTYQMAGGATQGEISAMYEVLLKLGWNIKLDKLFVFLAPQDVLDERVTKPDLIEDDVSEGNKKDRFESRGNDYMTNVINNYERVAQKEHVILDKMVDKIIPVDATQNIDDVFKLILNDL